MNTQVTINKLLAVVALICAILSFFIAGPLIPVAVILLALALII